MSNRRDIQFTYNPHNKATILDCSFKVDSANANGLGISGLNKSGRIANVFMNSAATFAGDTHTNTVVDNIADTSILAVGMLVQGSGIPAKTTIASITSATAITISNAATATASGVTITYAGVGSKNPNAGVIVVQFQDNYNKLLTLHSSIMSPLSGSSINISTGASLTIGKVYVITALGTSTQANWQAVGVPANRQAAVGLSFVASVTGSGTGTGTVQAIATAGSGIDHVEQLGNANLANSNGALVIGSGVGMQVILGCFKKSLVMNSYTPAGTNDSATPPIFTGTPAVLTGTVADVLGAPADGANIGLNFYLNNSSSGV